MKKLIFLCHILVFASCYSPSEKIQDPKHCKTDTVLLLPVKKSVSDEIRYNFREFVPKGFQILDSITGDLNLDAFPDMLLILKINGEDTMYDALRPLLILSGQANNSFKLEARNDSVVLCRSCGGVFGDPYDSSVIKNGYFSIQHYGGSNWRWTRIITFKYNKEKNKWILHKDARKSFHTSDPEKTEAIITNPKDFDVLPFEKFSNTKGF